MGTAAFGSGHLGAWGKGSRGTEVGGWETDEHRTRSRIHAPAVCPAALAQPAWSRDPNKVWAASPAQEVEGEREFGTKNAKAQVCCMSHLPVLACNMQSGK